MIVKKLVGEGAVAFAGEFDSWRKVFGGISLQHRCVFGGLGAVGDGSGEAESRILAAIVGNATGNRVARVSAVVLLFLLLTSIQDRAVTVPT